MEAISTDITSSDPPPRMIKLNRSENSTKDSTTKQIVESSTSSLDDTNPPLEIQEIKHSGLTFRVIRDDQLVSGTKQRATIPFIQSHSEYTEFVYAGPYSGYAQVALAFAASKFENKKATIFLERKNPKHPLTRLAISMGAKITEIDSANSRLWQLQEEASKYVQDQNKENLTQSFLMPFGMHSDQFIDDLEKQIRKAIPESLEQNPPKRLWMTVGSGTILTALHRIWPETHYMMVQVGKKIDEELSSKLKGTIFVAPQRFYENAPILPPYPSVTSYDAKVWQFVVKHGEEGDVIWNVGKDVTQSPLDSSLDDYSSSSDRRSSSSSWSNQDRDRDRRGGQRSNYNNNERGYNNNNSYKSRSDNLNWNDRKRNQPDENNRHDDNSEEKQGYRSYNNNRSNRY